MLLAVCCGVRPASRSLIPIKSTTTFGLPASSPFSTRQRTFSVLSPGMPKFAAFMRRKDAAQVRKAPGAVGLPSWPHMKVIESPRKTTGLEPE